MSKRPRPPRIGIQEAPPIQALAPPRNLDTRATITIDEKTFEVQADDLEKIADLGRGAYGVVEKMRHIKTGTVMAVKRITATVNTQEQVMKCIHLVFQSDNINILNRNGFSWILTSR